jgi:hypothetical protein
LAKKFIEVGYGLTKRQLVQYTGNDAIRAFQKTLAHRARFKSDFEYATRKARDWANRTLKRANTPRNEHQLATDILAACRWARALIEDKWAVEATNRDSAITFAFEAGCLWQMATMNSKYQAEKMKAGKKRWVRKRVSDKVFLAAFNALVRNGVTSIDKKLALKFGTAAGTIKGRRSALGLKIRGKIV